ncbi:PLP-dependent aminotransferase family protein [Luteolibacter yonseiensis]
MRPPQGGETLFAWLYRELRTAILSGRLKPGTQLPPTRTLARQWGIARGTVIRVFEQLLSESYLESRVGAGTTVNHKLPDDYFNAAAKAETPAVSAVKGRLSSRGVGMSRSPFLNPGEIRTVRAFSASQPSVSHFPPDLWSRLGARRMRLASREMLLAGDVLGYRPLREAIAAHLGSTRGVVCDVDQVMIVSGTQQALDLVARITLDPGDEVWMEDPGYPGATGVFRAAGAKLVPVPVDRNGMKVAEGLRRAPAAKLAYVTPANQFPLCVTLPLERRLKLLEWSRNTGAWIFEDDYDTEFRFDGRPLTAMQGLAPDGNVIFSGSFSKMLFPSLRMGYLVLPPHLVEPMRGARSLTDRFGPMIEQAVLSDFISEGHFGRYLRRMRQIYGENLDVLMTESGREWGDRLVLQPAQAGLQTIGWLADGRDDVEFCRAAQGCGVAVLPLSAWALRWKQRSGIQVGFAAVGQEEIRRGVRALATLL